jgi:DNA-binding beta-propeller fold protein YncE
MLREKSYQLNRMALLLVLMAGVVLTAGCLKQSNPRDAFVWGRKGLDDGRFIKPRALVVDDQDQVYVVDMTSRIQVFDREGKFLRAWKTPECYTGKPCGLSVSHDGMIMVVDTHYFRVLFYSPEGVLDESRTIGGKNGRGPKEFGFLTDAVQDSKNNYYISEYGDYDRIQKFSPAGDFLCQIAERGEAEGQFLRPQGLAIDDQDRLWVADACNHRIQVFDATVEPPEFLFSFGQSGSGIGELSYPYNILLGDDGFLYVTEYGNHRIQKFTTEGKSLGVWGSAGRLTGEMHQPWALAADSQNHIFVTDSYNHRMQRFLGIGERAKHVWSMEAAVVEDEEFIDAPPDQ